MSMGDPGPGARYCDLRGLVYDDAPLPLHPLQAITDAPAGYVPLAEGAQCKCIRSWKDYNGQYWCCLGSTGAVAGPVVPFTDPATEAATARRTIVAFTGLAGSGKSTAALHLVKSAGYQRIRFAGPLKDMMRALGLTEAEIEGDRKEVPCELLCGQTPRRAMQTIGTEWGRDIIGSDLWIRAWRAALDRVPAGVPVVVDDCRFPNEAEAVRAAGGLLIRIVRPGAGAGAAGHSSEAHALPADTSIENVGDVAALIGRIDQLARDVSWALA